MTSDLRRDENVWSQQDVQRSTQGTYQSSSRRRTLGPIVSDRRWGTDIGCLELPGTRISTLTKELEGILEAEITTGSKAHQIMSMLKQHDDCPHFQNPSVAPSTESPRAPN